MMVLQTDDPICEPGEKHRAGVIFSDSSTSVPRTVRASGTEQWLRHMQQTRLLVEQSQRVDKDG